MEGKGGSVSKQIIQKGLWAPVVRIKGGEYIVWQCISNTRKVAKNEFLLGVPPEHFERELKNVTFRRVYVATVGEK